MNSSLSIWDRGELAVQNAEQELEVEPYLWCR